MIRNGGSEFVVVILYILSIKANIHLWSMIEFEFYKIIAGNSRSPIVCKKHQ